jgi:hypothetical protein
MSNASASEKSRQERRLRSPGFLKSLGVERTTAFLIGAVAGLIFAFISILNSGGPATTEADVDQAGPLEIVAESGEPLIIPQ